MRTDFGTTKHDAACAQPAAPTVPPRALYWQINTLEKHQRSLRLQQHELDASKRHQHHLEHLTQIPEADLIEEVANARRETNKAFFDAFLGNERGRAVSLLSAGTIPLGVWFMRKSARWKHAEKALIAPEAFACDLDRARSITAAKERKVQDLQALVQQSQCLSPSR